MNNFRSEPFLWIHLAGIAVVPLTLQLVWLGLAVGNPLPFYGVELLIVIAVGIIPPLWMQWKRPFDIFSLLLVALRSDALTPDQRKLLTLFTTRKQKVLSLLVAAVMLVILWVFYQLAPLATSAAAFLPQWRLLGLAIAAIAFWLSNLFVQVPVSVLGVLTTSAQQWSETEPYLPENISQAFTVPGFRVRRILPIQPTIEEPLTP